MVREQDVAPRALDRRELIGRLGAWGVAVAAAPRAGLSGTAAAPLWRAAGHRAQVRMASLPDTDLAVQTSGPVAGLLYRDLGAVVAGMARSGATGVNARWERGAHDGWFIEEQRTGEVAVIGGVVTHDAAALAAAARMFDWGFARQAGDGSFPGTGDPFHSTSFFVAAVAHTCLFLRLAAASGRFPLAAAQLARFQHYEPLARRAARWMIRPAVWNPGLAGNAPFTHRRYLVAAALGLTGVLAGDADLVGRAHPVLEDGLARQRPDGVNPERGGHDSSYQMTGVVFAEYWATYLPDDPLTPRIRAMLARALAWEAGRVQRTGAVLADGNTRTAGQERSRNGLVKGIAYSRVIRGFATWAALAASGKEDPRWAELAWRVGHFYYSTPVLAAHPLLP